MRASIVAPALLLGAALIAPASVRAQTTSSDTTQQPGRFNDPTGGAYTSPTTLFIPAAALPSLMPRLTVGADVQTPAGNSPGGGLSAVRPYITGELGLPYRFTIAAGTQWFGGDNVGNSLTPFAQVRFQIFGRADGMGLLGGASLTYKRVGYHGGENELEASFSMQYRARRFEVGAQGTFGQSLDDGNGHDIEARLYAAVRPIPSLALGVSGQVRGDIGGEEGAVVVVPGRNDFDVIGGAIASLTISRWQIGALVGASTLGVTDNVAFLSQLQGAVRF